MSYVFNKGVEGIGDGTIDLTAGTGHKVWVAVLKSNSECVSSAAAAKDKDTLSAITLQESTASGYARQKLTLTKTLDDTNDRVVWGASNTTWTVTGSDVIGGLLVYYDADDDGASADDASNVPICFIDSGGISGTTFNGTLTITWTSVLLGIAG